MLSVSCSFNEIPFHLKKIFYIQSKERATFLSNVVKLTHQIQKDIENIPRYSETEKLLPITLGNSSSNKLFSTVRNLLGDDEKRHLINGEIFSIDLILISKGHYKNIFEKWKSLMECIIFYREHELSFFNYDNEDFNGDDVFVFVYCTYDRKIN